MTSAKLKTPRTFQAGCSLLAGMMTSALVNGPSSHRRYNTKNGPLDADYFDEARTVLVGLASDTSLTRLEATQIIWELSRKLWIANDFAGAEEMTRRVIEDGSYLAEHARKQLALILAGLPPEAALDDAEITTPPLPLDARTLSVSYVENIEGEHCCMLEANWTPVFSKTSKLGIALNDGLPIPVIGDCLGSAKLWESARQSAPMPSDVGIASRYLLASERGLGFLRPHLPPDAHVFRFALEGHGAFHAISLAETDCLVELSSCVTKTRKGRLKIARGMFKESEIMERPLLQQLGSWEIFVSVKYSKAFLRAARENGIKGIRLLEDISRR